MAIMRTNDWKKIIQLCKNEISKTEGDKRAARGLLYRLTFYISENRLVHPQRRRQEPHIQTLMFDGASRGKPLSPKEVLNAKDDIRVEGSSKFTTREEDSERSPDDSQSNTHATGSS